MELIGKSTKCLVAADVPFTNNAIPATVGLVIPLGIGERVHIRAHVLVSGQSSGGIRYKFAQPAGPALFHVTSVFYDPGGNITGQDIMTENTDIVHDPSAVGVSTVWVDIEGSIENGVTPGNLDLQFAQDTSDPATTTVLKGGWMEVVQY